MAKAFEEFRDFDRAAGASREERLARLDRLARLMDAAIVIPGTSVRFGADAVIGLVPGVGDLVTAGLSCMIILEARRMGAPNHLLARMLGNLVIDAAAGSIPVLGDIFDLAFRANLRNMRLLRRHFERASPN